MVLLSPGAILPEAFYARDALVVARELLGKIIVHGEVAVRITEVEAYRCLPEGDTANHSRFGRTARNAPMWGPPGRAYVYLIYGMHPMLNLVTGQDGGAEAVLIRAAEPVVGLDVIVARRKWTRAVGPVLLTGPGKVAHALGLDTGFSHHVLFEAGGLTVHNAPRVAAALVGPRIGIDYASEEHQSAPWRLADAGSAWVAHKKRLVAEPEVALTARAARPDSRARRPR